MAKKQKTSTDVSQQSSESTTNSFNKGMVKDYDVSFTPDGTWNHARNAANNSKSGDIGLIGNESANEFCTQAPYTIIGIIPIFQDYFAIFSTDDTDSEIGLFHQPSCSYYSIVNDQCLSFNRQNLIIGDSKYKFDCSYDLYWDDGLNPSRTLNIGSLDAPYPDIFNNEPWPGVPYVCRDVNTSPNDPNGTDPNGVAYCVTCEPLLPLQLDCDKVRLDRLMKIPCVSVKKGLSGGQLLNGSYYAVIAYSQNEQRMTDYFNPSEIQSLFVHGNARSSLDLTFTNLDTENFEQFQLVIVATTNQQTVATEIGYYSTRTKDLSVDFISPTANVVPLNTVPLRTPGYEKSEAMYDVNGYLIRVAPTDRLDFNYQPFANQITAEWIMTEQPYDYYEKGGNQIGYMRDEVYAFWIRWVYNDGKKSSSYHIPGRRPFDWEVEVAGTASDDNIEWQEDNNYQTKVWEVYNTAYPTSNAASLPVSNYPVSLTQGTIIARGKMGYWQSTEKYPDDKPEVWNATSNPSLFTVNANNYNYDLCGKNIRHHKMPSDVFHSDGSGIGDFYSNDNFSHIRSIDGVNSPILGITPTTPVAIRILGVQFFNIKAPVDNDGNIIPGIVGYEILRSSRQGNKSIVAKGIINNMRSYKERGPSDNYQPDDTEILYPNYLSNYQGADFTLTSSDETTSQNSSLATIPYLKRDYFTFHSPDTNFEYPYLSATELKFYGEKGSNFNMEGLFEPVPGHPKEKLLTNMALLIGAVVGLGIAFRGIRGRDIRTASSPAAQNAGVNGAPGFVSTSINGALAAVANGTYSQAIPSVFNNIGIAASGADAALATLAAAWGGINLTLTAGAGGLGSRYDTSTEYSDYRYVPLGFKTAGGFLAFGYYWAEGTEQAIKLIRAIVPFRDYVMRSRSEIKLFKFQRGGISLGKTRRLITESTYLDNQFQTIGNQRVNNLYRSRCVGLHTSRTMTNVATVVDRSLQTIGSLQQAQTGVVNKGITYDRPTGGKFYATGAAYYGALKVRFRNQYGPIASTNQITTGCAHLIRSGLFVDVPIPQSFAGQVVVQSTPEIFGGDTYVSRYTEKNTFFYFYDWLYNVPDGVEINYTLKYMITYPKYWANFQSFSADDFVQQVAAAASQITLFNPGNVNSSQAQTKIGAYAFFNLDGASIGNGFYTTGYSQSHNRFRLGVRNAYMYLFQSGIRDFFVESEYNADHRDYGDRPEEKIYDPYGFTDTKELFDTSIIKNGNYYKYDISLGVSRTMNNYISFGTAQGPSYNPFTAESCYKYYPFRVIYSLQASQEDKKDYWRIFLINNYYDFDSRVTAFKSINRNGAIILLEKNSPLMFNAVDTLQTTSGTKITIGDGGLFSQPLQTLSNADIEFQHGSCQDRLSIINTPAGVFWMSSSQGKIFTVSEGMQPISDLGMKWWFSKYLHYFLLDQFPNYGLVGNPVAGIGCQAIFDNENQIIYFSKTDYKIKDEFLEVATYSPTKSDSFYINNAKVEIGDPTYFDNLSWTVSFDPKIKAWISFHDWHPELGISNIKGFFTTKTENGLGNIWKHYNNTSKFCNYYGVDYPFEIDYISATGQAVTTTRSIEYLLECYVYDQDGIDRYEVLDYNFDKAIVYNNEQVSGNLRLNLSPKNNAPVIVNYPQIDTLTGIINILYSKEEQKYRFNQFWDFTRNRGEFQTGGILVQQPIWNTELNGYIRTLNNNNINLNKSPFERKKFRHYANHVVLIRTVSNNVKMLLKVTNNKLLNSPR